jgi:Zn finger protein HypA/HybF involved in hydrogenase expression
MNSEDEILYNTYLEKMKKLIEEYDKATPNTVIYYNLRKRIFLVQSRDSHGLSKPENLAFHRKVEKLYGEIYDEFSPSGEEQEKYEYDQDAYAKLIKDLQKKQENKGKKYDAIKVLAGPEPVIRKGPSKEKLENLTKEYQNLNGSSGDQSLTKARIEYEFDIMKRILLKYEMNSESEHDICMVMNTCLKDGNGKVIKRGEFDQYSVKPAKCECDDCIRNGSSDEDEDDYEEDTVMECPRCGSMVQKSQLNKRQKM